MTAKKRMLVIENPQAGKKRPTKSMADAMALLRDAGYELDLRQTAQKGDAGRFAAEYGAGYDLIVCVGGDGTFNDAVGGLARAGAATPVGYIPTGSSNDFAGSLSLPHDPLAAAQNILDGAPWRVDLVRFDRQLFSNAAEFGAFTWLGYTTPQIMKNVLGPTAYVLSGIRDLPKIQPVELTVTAGERVFAGNYIFGAICNTTRIGAVALPAGVEAPDDGMFEVLLVRQPLDFIAWQQTVAGLLSREYPPQYIDFVRTDRIVIDSKTPVSWCLDGEKLIAPLRTEVKVIPGALTLMTARTER